jgi:phosphoribosyl 1,2-cyclic phosphodiesterase
MRFVPLGSGSKGNATLVESGSTRILIDAGLSARALGSRLGAVGVAAGEIDFILLSHDHTDHVRGAERFSRLHRVPVLSSIETLEAMDRSPVHFAAWEPLPENGSVSLGNIDLECFPVPHDAARPVGFVLRCEGLRLAMATDLGHATTLVLERMRGSHLVMIESNHDEQMLKNGPYPWQLKQRVAGRTGHLSNDEAAAVLEEVVEECCQAVVLAHLSAKNNRPELARKTAARALSAVGMNRLSMRVAAERCPTPTLEL